MATKKPASPSAEEAALFAKLIGLFPDVELKGASMPYTSINGNMFSFLNAQGLMGLRLPAAEREAFLKKYGTTLFEAHGTVMKEYVTVPGTLLHRTGELKEHFEVGLAHARTLKPKATQRRIQEKK